MRRNIKNPIARNVFFFLAGSLTVYHLLLVTVLLLDTIYIVAVDLMVAMVLIFCLYPATKRSPQDRMSGFDIVLALAAIAVGIYSLSQAAAYYDRMGEPNTYDIVMGSLCIVLTLEATRRTTGFALPSIAGAAILYCFFGNYAPGAFKIKPLTIERVIYQLFCGLEGIYGTVLIVLGTVIFLFFIFAGFVKGSKVGDFFMDSSYALLGRTVGGPAKLAVTASGLMGMLTGAGAANVAATGNVTIPLMKKYGYKPHIAGAIEAAASTGGQFLPPIMGATAFIIAQVTGISYATICIVSFLPALLYMASVIFYVHLEAKKSAIALIDEREVPSLKKVLKEGGHLVFPVVILFTLILMEYSLGRAALLSIASVIVVSFVRKHTRMNVRSFIWALKESGLDMLILLSVGGSAGILLGVVSQTGLGLKFSSFFISAAGGSLFLMICLIAIASLIFGMGLPVVASYILLATLAGPALETMGVPVLIAHLVLLWFSVDACVTPPVAIVSYVAAGIAKAPIMPTAWESWKAAKGLYVVPFLMVYGPLISGNLFQKFEVTFMALFGFYALTASLKGYFFRRTLLFERLLLLLAGSLLLFPVGKGYIPLAHLAGLFLFLCLAYVNKRMFTHLHDSVEIERRSSSVKEPTT